MNESDYQNFLPVDVTDAEADPCKKLLPVNTLTQRLTFYKTLVFTDEIDLIDEAPPAGLQLPILALPAPFLHPAFNHAYQPLGHSAGRVSWTDGSFLPSDAGEKLAARLSLEKIKIETLEDIEETLESLKQVRIRNKAAVAERLKRAGLAYLRKSDGTGFVELRIEAETLTIPSGRTVIRTGTLQVGDKNAKVTLSPRAAAQLARSGTALATLDKRPVRLVESKPRARYSIASSSRRRVANPTTTPGDIGLLLELAPHPRFVHNDWFCHWLAELEQGAAEVDFGNPFFADESEQADLAELLQHYRDDARAATCGKTQPTNGTVAAKPPSTRYQIGLVGTYHQDWKLLGYSRGALLSTITLAPREQLQIEVFTWDRKKIEQEHEFGTEYETNVEINSLSRASAQIGHELSETIGTNASVNGGISVPVEAVNVNVGGTAGVTTEVTESLNTTLESINEHTAKAIEKFKATNRVKIVETSESGSETRTTRTIANPNSGLTLTLNYFEVLENYEVVTQPVHATEWCVLVDNPDVLNIDFDFVLAHEHILQKSLLSANYKEGFEAARMLVAQRWFESTLEPEGHTDGETDEEPGFPLTGIFGTAKSLQEVITEFIALDDDIDEEVDGGLSLIEAAMNGLAVHAWPGIESPLSKAQHADYETRITRYIFWKKLEAIHPGFEERARHYVDNVSDLFSDEHNKDEIIRQVSLLVDGFDDDWLYAVKMFAASAAIALLLAVVSEVAVTAFLIPIGAVFLAPFIVPAATTLLSPMIIGLSFQHDDAGLPPAIAKAKRQLKAAEAAQAAQANIALVQPDEEGPIEPEVAEPKVYELRELAEANANWEKLRLHLEKYRIYYQNEIFRAEDFDERYERLRMMGLAPFVENRLLGFAGKRAIMPLRLHTLPDGVQSALQQKYADIAFDEIKPKSQTATLPTSGVHVESVLGQCDALEPYLHERREIDLGLRKAQLDLADEQTEHAKQETKRLESRLNQDPPLLDDPGITLPGEAVPDYTSDDLFDDI